MTLPDGAKVVDLNEKRDPNAFPEGSSNTTAIAEGVAKIEARRWKVDDRLAENPAAREPSQLGTAEALRSIHDGSLRWDAICKRWIEWSEGYRHWTEVSRERMHTLCLEALRLQREMAAGAVALEDREKASLFAWTIRAGRARVLDEIADTARFILEDNSDAWDSEPHLLGVAGGRLVDLRTGRARDRERADRILLSTSVRFDPTAASPRWDQFLDEIFDGDRGLVDYLQLAIGYTITGETREQCFFINNGPGGNGKGTLTRALRNILGSYVVNARAELFAELRRGGNQPDLRSLDGLRMVTCTEIDDGAIFRESRIKAMTGEDPITFRPLYQSDPYTFVPRCKVWLFLNHLPATRDLSHAFWRRVRLLPFNVKFDPRDDPGLEDELRTEEEGILAWAVRGAVRYYRVGLGTPEAVQEATGIYREDSDPLAAFLGDRCQEGDGVTATRSELWLAYDDWADTEKMPHGSRVGSKRFSQLLAERFERARLHGGTRVFRGIGVTRGET